MKHLQCQQLHSSVRQQISKHFINRSKSVSLTPSCQFRSGVHLTTRANEDDLLELIQIDESLDKLTKASPRKRVPIGISSNISDQVDSPVLLSLHSYITSGDTKSAWKLFDKATLKLSQQPIPRATTKALLKALYSEIRANHFRTSYKRANTQEIYIERLEKLVGLVKKTHFWEKQEFCMMIEICSRVNQIRRAETMLRNFNQYCQEDICTKIYNEILIAYIRQFSYENISTKRRYLSKMETILQEIIRKNLVPDETSFNMILAAKIKAQDLLGAERLFTKMTVTPNRTTYNIMLNGILKAGRSSIDKKVAEEWLDKMIGSGISPNMKTFKNVVDGLAEQIKYHVNMGNKKETEEIVLSVSDLHDISCRFGKKTDTEMMNDLLTCYTAAKDVNNIEKMIGMLALPGKKSGRGNCGCEGPTMNKKTKLTNPDTYTFNILIKYYLSTKDTEQAFQTYDTMVSMDFEPDTVTYGNFLSYYMDRGEIEEGLKYYQVMKKKEIPLNNYIYNMLLSSSIKYTEYSHLITPCLNEMAASNIFMDDVSRNIILSKQTKNENIDTSFDILLNSLDKNFFSARESERTSSTRRYNTLLQTTGRYYKSNRGKFVQILDSIMKTLNTSEIQPDLMTYAVGIRNASYQGNMQRAESIYKTMMNSGFKPNHYIFSHLIYGYSYNGKMDKAQEILDSMYSHDITPNVINYSPLIKAYVESAEYQKARALFKEMLSKNISPDIVVYTILAEAFLYYPTPENGNTAISLLENIEKAGMDMDAASMTLLIDAYSIDAVSKVKSKTSSIKQENELIKNVDDRTVKINAIYDKLKKRKWLDSQAVFVILSSHIRMKNLKDAWKVWNESVPLNLLHRAHYDLLISGFSLDRSWYSVAKLTYEEMARKNTLRPRAYTFDTMIWAAYMVGDHKMVRELWESSLRIDSETNKPYILLVRSYFAVMDVMLRANMVDEVKEAFKEYQATPNRSNSSAVWNQRISHLTSWLDKDVS